MNLHLDETIRRNLRKTPDERVETLMAALRDVEARGLWPRIDRKAKEQRIIHGLCVARTAPQNSASAMPGNSATNC